MSNYYEEEDNQDNRKGKKRIKNPSSQNDPLLPGLFSEGKKEVMTLFANVEEKEGECTPKT